MRTTDGKHDNKRALRSAQASPRERWLGSDVRVLMAGEGVVQGRTLTRRDSSLRWRSTSLGTMSSSAQASSLRGLPILAYDHTRFVISYAFQSSVSISCAGAAFADGVPGYCSRYSAQPTGNK